MKNPNNPIGNRTRYLPACSSVPHPTAPPHTRPPSPSPTPKKGFENSQIMFAGRNAGKYLRLQALNRAVVLTLLLFLRGWTVKASISGTE